MPNGAAPRTGGGTAAAAAPRIVVAFDFGLRRIGVACGDTLSRSAAPLHAIMIGRSGLRFEPIDAVLREWQPSLIVVGLPYNVDGSESPMTARARDFAAKLERRHPIEVALVDERYSSLEAEGLLRSARDAGVRKRRVAKADVDAAAACVILQRWFTEKH
jgi:putative Holliday junction resolvase